MTKIKALILLYENELDIDAESFVDEFIQFQSLIPSTNNSTYVSKCRNMFAYIFNNANN